MWLCSAFVAVFVWPAAWPGLAGEKKDMGGWERSSPYNALYDASELDSFKGEIVKIREVTPIKGMSPAVAIYVKEAADEVIEVHVCPSWYMNTAATGLKRGDRVKVRGVWSEINGRDIFMASKIKKGDYFVLKVRLTKDGTPFWTMTPEQLAIEQDAAGSR
jgi:hypothetical protein